MYRLFDLIRSVRAALQPYTVIVSWDGDLYAHRAWTTADAYAWLQSYPAGASARISTRSGRLVARVSSKAALQNDFPVLSRHWADQPIEYVAFVNRIYCA